jgi:hypothetical protein
MTLSALRSLKTVADDPTNSASNGVDPLMHLTFIYKRQLRLNSSFSSPIRGEAHANPRAAELRNASTNPTTANIVVSVFLDVNGDSEMSDHARRKFSNHVEHLRHVGE